MRVGCRGVLVLFCVPIVACGGARSLSPTAVGSSSLTLNSGPYMLTLADSSGTICENGICRSVIGCVSIGATGPSSDSVAVAVQRSGDSVEVTPLSAGSLRMSLQASGASVTGSISGTTTGVSGLQVGASGTISGGAGGVISGAAGTLNGQLTIGSTSCTSTGHNWRLAPR